jgi:hypothetical protein
MMNKADSFMNKMIEESITDRIATCVENSKRG